MKKRNNSIQENSNHNQPVHKVNAKSKDTPKKKVSLLPVKEQDTKDQTIEELKSIYQIFKSDRPKASLLKGLELPKPFSPKPCKTVPEIPYHTGFFREPLAQPNFDYLWSSLLTLQDIKLQKRIISKDKRGLFEIPPVLCSDNVLYYKKGAHFCAISFNDDNPCFLIKDLQKKVTQKLQWSDVEKIVSKWLNFSPSAKTLLEKLAPVYENCQDNRLQRAKVLPSFQDVYTFYSLKFWQSSIQNKHQYGPFSIPPTVCNGNQIFSKAGDCFYRVEASKIIKFDKLIQNKSYLMTSMDVYSFLTNALDKGVVNANQSSSFKKQYKETHAPIFKDGHNQRISSTERDEYIEAKSNYALMKKRLNRSILKPQENERE